MKDFVSSSRRSLLLIVSGPAGSGKTTLCDGLLAEFKPRLQRVVTATSRPPRAGEVDGVDYLFLTPEQFEERVAAGAFYEHAKVHANRYGVLREAVLSKLDASVDLLLNIDVQGAASFRSAARVDPRMGERIASVFIMPRSIDQLRERLAGRGSDDEAEIERRMQTAQIELKAWKSYDYCIVSGSREEDYERIRAIYQAEMLKSGRLDA
ncbi:MAG: guanylate kinase [Opitutales bacterium]|nr:guanylate kinase [Opitutales bacterium]